MAPATVGLAAVQINIFVNSYFASFQPGAVAWLNYAFRILYLPIGIFGVAVGTIATTGLARRAASGDLPGLSATLRQSLSMLAFLTVPATAGLMVLGVPIVRLLYERGRFTSADTESTAGALLVYAIGLVAYTGVKVLAPAFYALGTPRVPLLASGLAVLTNVAINLAFFGRFGYRAVALGTALGSLANVAVLLVAFERRVGGLRKAGLGGGLARIGTASAVMALTAWLLARGLETRLGAHTLSAQLATGLLPVVLGVGVYGLLAHWLRVPEAAALRALLHREGRRQDL
jgi:putative peptidoglycan lipid II flippase